VNSLQNIAISAAAGSGKTYQLTNRFIYLLHLSEAPERIIALTFTRTAAGEFFDKIIEKLCTASSSANAAAALSAELGIKADASRYKALLKLLIEKMHRLNLQTLDSFFFKVVSSFSLELGLSGSLQLLDSTSEPRMHDRVRDSIVHQAGDLDAALNEFWHAFKQATYGREERSVDRVVAEFIDSLYSLYLESPAPNLWGQPDQIWPSGNPWRTSGSTDWDALTQNLIQSLPDTLSASQRKDFETAAAKVSNYPIEETTNTLLSRGLEQTEEIFAGHTILQCGRGKKNQAELTGIFCEALADCLRAIVWHHLERALQNTQGVHRILQAYHENYDRIVRQPGKLAFADLTHLLNQQQDGVHSIDRTLLDYRLDAKFDHWLFDEFQDTSRPQWHVVADLIDEIIQDDSGTRSFFYVGDTKQCLYLWRNSDDRLFHDIQTHYNQNETRIVQNPLSVSWRSAPAILDAVNTIFKDNAAIENCFGNDAAQRWQRAWQTHKASPATKNLSGFACWLEASKSDAPDRNELILQTLRDLKPLERGMTVGILVRQNKHANAVAEYLREHSNLPIHTGSSVQPATDNAAGAALLSMLRLAAHPGDALARGYLALIDQSTAGESLLEACPELRERILTTHSEAAVRWATQKIKGHLSTDDTRHQQRLDDLVHIARAYGQEDTNDVDGLHDFLSKATTGEAADQGAIIVETVHKSKGLEYDVVIFVNEDKTSKTESRISPLLNSTGEADWILEPIKKELMQADPELVKFLEQSESRSGFERLCTLYVAMTRAKRALYMISDLSRIHQKTTIHYLKDILGETATNKELFPQTESPFAYPMLWRTGDQNWHQSFEIPQAEPAKISEPSTVTFAPAHPRLQLSRPSQSNASSTPPARYFDLEQQALELGSQVHAAFETIEWWSHELEITSLAEEGSTLDILKKCFADSAFQKCFTPSSSTEKVWRERDFACVEGDQYLSGTFDRVHIESSSDGKLCSAQIIDFKTDRIHPNNTLKQAIEKHRPQLESYRKALSKITGLKIDQIELTLLFTDAVTVSKL
jgi:ATP-dependent helicase/nuclease subunit A